MTEREYTPAYVGECELPFNPRELRCQFCGLGAPDHRVRCPNAIALLDDAECCDIVAEAIARRGRHVPTTTGTAFLRPKVYCYSMQAAVIRSVFAHAFDVHPVDDAHQLLGIFRGIWLESAGHSHVPPMAIRETLRIHGWQTITYDDCYLRRYLGSRADAEPASRQRSQGARS